MSLPPASRPRIFTLLLPRSIHRHGQYSCSGSLYAHICVLHDEDVVHSNDVDVLHAGLLELVKRLDIAWDLAGAGAGERAWDSDLDHNGGYR